jgi:hypothetical protein
MDVHGYPWMFMETHEIHGYPQISSDINGYPWKLWGQCGVSLWPIPVGSLCGDFGVTLGGSVWGHCGITLELIFRSLRGHIGPTLGLFLRHSGISLGSVWGHFQVSLVSLQERCGTNFGVHPGMQEL